MEWALTYPNILVQWRHRRQPIRTPHYGHPHAPPHQQPSSYHLHPHSHHDSWAAASMGIAPDGSTVGSAAVAVAAAGGYSKMDHHVAAAEAAAAAAMHSSMYYPHHVSTVYINTYNLY